MGKDKLDYGPDNCGVTFEADGSVCIRFDPNTDLGESKSGKTTIVARTVGNMLVAVPSTGKQIRIGLKVFTPKT